MELASHQKQIKSNRQLQNFLYISDMVHLTLQMFQSAYNKYTECLIIPVPSGKET